MVMKKAAKKTMTRQTAEVSAGNVERYLNDYVEQRRLADAYAQRAETMKTNLRAFLVTHGEPDEKGNVWVDVGDRRMKNERRVANRFDSGKATAWLKKNGMWDDYKVVVEEVDEDKVMAAGYEGTIARRTVDSFMVSSESFAFKVL